MKHTNSQNKGSVLVATIAITAVLLAVGITLSSILQKDILRQLYGKRSQIAMNVANSALECVLFNDFQRNTFETLLTRKHNALDCGELYQVRKGSDWSVIYTPSSDESNSTPPGTGTYQFVIIDAPTQNLSRIINVPCAHVTVKKVCSKRVTGNNTCADGLIESSIEVKGYSTCSSGEAEASRDLVRRFKVYY